MSPQSIRSYADVTKVRDNEVYLTETSESEFVSSSVEFAGTGNVLYVEDGVMLRNSRLRFLGNDSVIYIRKSSRYTRLVATVFEESVLYVGPEASFTSEAHMLPTERKHIIIGRDAMFASRVALRTADPHLVYSVDSHQRVNPSASIWVGDHVWLGEDALLLKGARVGSGSILAARCLVTKRIPSNSTAAGVPARTVGDGIFWARPSVHSFNVEQTEQSQVLSEDDFIFEQDEHALDIDALENELDAASSGSERAVWCHRLDQLDGKNRFYIA
ncbi:acyltransferase [Paenarthrobacter sp. 2TAF44]|uniref:acyltransferase n=1 Tax=Paenarthrobacter sp. 2TAF44 TaxID=3233018 RepID=UPI003F9A0B46